MLQILFFSHKSMAFDLGYASSTRFFYDLDSGVVITVGSFLTPRRRFILKWTYPPLGWGLGAALVAWLGVIELDIPTAFVTGFIVGLVHDLALAAFGIPKWGDVQPTDRTSEHYQEDA